MGHQALWFTDRQRCKRYNPRSEPAQKMMRAMKLICAVAMLVCWLTVLDSSAAQAPLAPSRWAQPAAELAGQIADILGPGQAQLTVRNLSTIPTGEVPVIRKLLEQDLKAHGVLNGGAESANAIRVTLSEDIRERLWVAEIVQGNETRVAMVHVDAASATPAASIERVVLRKERMPGLFNGTGPMAQDNPILGSVDILNYMVILFADRLSVFRFNNGEWVASEASLIGDRRPARDPRGVVVRSTDGYGFDAFTAGVACSGRISQDLLNNPGGGDRWSIRCHTSDDPWPVYQSADASSAPAVRAFYNTARDYFTGVVTPAVGVDLPPFYSAGMIPRAAGGAAMLLTGVDGKVQMVENGAMRTVSGGRDWGSDFAVVRSGCGSGTQVIASSSGEATNDDLRAFEIPGLEAMPMGAPLAMDGTVTALWTASDGKSAMAAVRNAGGGYEVDRVTALCN